MTEPVDVTRGGQTYCDWCLDELSPASIRASEQLGLHGEFAWACAPCLKKKAYLRPPEGWVGPATDWPWHLRSQ